ncbi:MAG: ECF transporter S component [Clostridia bacterium]|nr:ECF transporter S component [Clostridia bacterium]
MKRIALIGMFSALAFIVLLLCRIPIVLFLKYEPKDVIITIGGFILGPTASLLISVIVSLIEFATISGTGIWGLIMNVLSTCSFACTAAYIYKKDRTLRGAVLGLITGCIFMSAVMLAWNWLITPIYMKVPRETVQDMLIPTFLPFNLLKGSLNAALTMLLYKPVIEVLRRASLVTKQEGSKKRFNPIWVVLSFILAVLLGLLFYFFSDASKSDKASKEEDHGSEISEVSEQSEESVLGKTTE